MKNNFITSFLRLSDIKEKGDGKKLLLRYVFSALGVMFIGIGCGAVVEMAVGCDTYTCFNRGIWYILTEKFGEFPFGHINLSVNILLFIFMLIKGRELIGFGTLFNMVCVGYIIDFMHYLFELFGFADLGLGYVVRVLLVAAALPVIALGGALYIEASLGVSPFDAVPLIFEKLSGGKLGFPLLRTLTDCFCLVFGFVFGLFTGTQFMLVNAGTVILALFTGVLIGLWRKLLEKNKSKKLY